MKKAAWMTVMIITMVLFVITFAHAEADKEKEPEGVVDKILFYNTHIDHKIKAAEFDAELKDSHYEDLRCLARHGKKEAAFYRENRNRLIKEMLQQDLTPQDHKVHLFLIQAFHEAYPEAKDMCK